MSSNFLHTRVPSIILAYSALNCSYRNSDKHGECNSSNIFLKQDIKVCGEGILIQILCFGTLSTVLFLFKTHNVSETGFCLHLQVKPTQLGPIDRASPSLRTPAPTQDRVHKQSTA
jgi:hypothetical protein